MRANTKAGFATADFDNRAGGFVAKDARRRNEAEMDFFDVGRTNTADGDFDEEFIWTDGWDRNGFKAQVIGSAIDYGAHGFRNIEHQKDLNRMESKGTH